MPTMYEIYESHAAGYDELVGYEDCDGNLKTAINGLYDFTGKTVTEFGVGTGRVTNSYIDKAARVQCFDRSKHMMSRARENLKEYAPKLSFAARHNLEARGACNPANAFIEGWAFGHTVYDDPDNHRTTIDNLVTGAESLVKPGGTVILIETMGSNSPEPFAPGELLAKFYQALEQDYGYTRTVISTDYQFPTLEDAARIMGFFFGDGMADEINHGGTTRIREFTGIWSKTLKA